MLHDGGMVTFNPICHFSSTLVWINVFQRSPSNPEDLPEHGASLMSKRSSLKWENYFLVVLSPMALSPYIPISPFSTPFTSVHSYTHYLQMTLICKLKHNSWTLNKKWQSINKTIATGIPTREIKRQPNIIIIIIRAFCPRAGPTLQTQEPRLQFYQGLNRCGSSHCSPHPSLSLKGLKNLKRLQGHQRGGEESGFG